MKVKSPRPKSPGLHSIEKLLAPYRMVLGKPRTVPLFAKGGTGTVVKIRKATLKDWKTIQKLDNEVFKDNSQYDKHLNLKWPFLKKGGVEYYQKVVADDKYFCIIAGVNNKPVGYLVGLEKNYDYRKNRVGEIDNMGTTPEYRSKGIGTILVNEFKKWCKQKGITQIYASTYFKSYRAIKFYKKQGMQALDIALMGDVD